MDANQALHGVDLERIEAVKNQARGFVARFLAEAAVAGDESVPLWGHAHAFAYPARHSEPPRFVPSEEQVGRCLDEFQLLVQHATFHRLFFAFADLDLWGAAMLVLGYVRRSIGAGRTVPSRPVLLSLLESGISQWPTATTPEHQRTRLADDACGTMLWIAERLRTAGSGAAPGAL